MFWQGLFIGFSIAAPVGPIGVLCIRRTLTEGRAAGLVSGLGAASADALYGVVAAFGLMAITMLLYEQQWWLRLVSGLFLCYLGLRMLRARLAAQAAQSSTLGRGLGGAYLLTFAVTITNPPILPFVTALGVASNGGNYLTASMLVFGMFIGSALWWLLLSGGVSLFRNRFDAHALV